MEPSKSGQRFGRLPEVLRAETLTGQIPNQTSISLPKQKRITETYLRHETVSYIIAKCATSLQSGREIRGDLGLTNVNHLLLHCVSTL